MAGIFEIEIEENGTLLEGRAVFALTESDARSIALLRHALENGCSGAAHDVRVAGCRSVTPAEYTRARHPSLPKKFPFVTQRMLTTMIAAVERLSVLTDDVLDDDVLSSSPAVVEIRRLHDAPLESLAVVAPRLHDRLDAVERSDDVLDDVARLISVAVALPGFRSPLLAATLDRLNAALEIRPQLRLV